MSYGALRYLRASPDGGIGRTTWGWRNGRIWVCCHACGVPRDLLALASRWRADPTSCSVTHPSIGSHGQVQPIAICDRPGCGVEVHLVLGGWTDDDAATLKLLRTGGLDAA